MFFSFDSVRNVDHKIERFLRKSRAQTYPPQYAPELSPDPIITPVSSPFPLFKGAGLHLRLADFGSGEPHQGKRFSAPKVHCRRPIS